MKNYRTLLRQEKWQLFLATMLGGFALSASLLLLVFSAWLISAASQRPPILTLEVVIVSVRFFGIGRGVFRYAGRLVDHKAALRIQGELRLSLYRSFALSPQRISRDNTRGKLLTTVVQAIDSVHDLWIRIFSPYLSSLFTALIGLGVVHQLCPQLLLPLSAVLLLAFVIPILSSIFEPSRKRSNNQRVEEAAIYEEMELLLSSLRESILFHYYNALFSEIIKAQKRLQKILNRKYFYQSANEIRISALFGISLFLTLRYGVTAVRNGQMPGVDFAVMALIPLAIFDPISAIPASLVFKNRARESEAEINKALESSGEQENIIDEFSQSPVTSMEAIQSLELKSISALLGEDEFPPVSVRLTPGEIGIISGKSGCGKSSLLNALIGQLPHKGEYLINNSTDVQKYFPYFSVLLQDDHLFTTSLRENLLIANPTLSDEEIWELLEIVELRERFETDPQGLDTFIGASIGMTTMPISAGEAQRLRFIRALARPADLYLWDEPFEYLDRELIARLLPKSIAYLKRKGNPIIMAISHIPLEINNVDLTTTYISLTQSGVDK